MKLYNHKLIQDEKRELIKYRKLKINKENGFLNSLKIIETSTKKQIKMNIDLDKKRKNNYLYIKFASEYLHMEQIKLGKVPIFITATLPSSFHPLTTYEYKTQQRLKKPIKNINYESSNTVEEGYIMLNDFHRKLYNGFRINNKRLDIKYISAVEMDSQLVPHTHTIYYLPDDKEIIDLFEV